MTHQADPVFIALIPLLYLIFAGQLWWHLRHVSDSKAKRAIRNLMLVFLGCATAGYLTDLFDVGRAANNFIHILQALAAGALVSSMASKHIAKALNDADD